MTARLPARPYLCGVNFTLSFHLSHAFKMKKLIAMMFFFAGIALVQVSAQSTQCTPSPACCAKTTSCAKPSGSAAAGAATSATTTAATEAQATCTPQQAAQCTPDQAKQCVRPSGSAAAAPAKAPQRKVLATQSESRTTSGGGR
jgi:hypothetical protein